MFYSQTFLGRKGPLGTVWCAAHLQHKLKKSHYISTNIPSTVERIMYPEVPIALRMSGHLLLGVARIYSKQVDYLYEDCHVVQITINKAFTTVNVNLPEDATHAPFHSVTFPERFELDAMELDDTWNENNHLKSQEEITLTEQIPTGKDPFIVITFDEDSPANKSRITPMEEDVPHSDPGDRFQPGFEDLSSSKQAEVDGGLAEERSSPIMQSPERMRDGDHDFGFGFDNSPILPDRADPDPEIERQMMKDMETQTPHQEMPEVPSTSLTHQEPHSNNLSEPNTPSGFPDHQTSGLQIPATSPDAQPQQIVRRRKRKQHFDKSTVLSNRYMRKSLNDTSDIRRAKKNCPCTSLDIWKLNIRKRKNEVLFEPLMTGVCDELRETFKDDFISEKLHSKVVQEAPGEAEVVPSPSRGHDAAIETARSVINEYVSTEKAMPSSPTPSPPCRRNDITPDNTNYGLQSEHAETTEGAATLPMSDIGASAGTSNFDMETPNTFNERSALSDIPELVTSVGELDFLDQEDKSPAGSQGTPEAGVCSNNQRTPELHALSSRTRALAQYFKRQASVTPVSGISEDSSGDLSLLKILEGKPRKICARMFYETLALKNYGYVDVHQEKPYDDITLKLTAKLSKEQL